MGKQILFIFIFLNEYDNNKAGEIMSIPDYETIMLPLLKYVGDGNEHSVREAVIYISDHFSLTEEEKNETLASGQTYVYNRVGWARTYMLKAGLLEKTTRGVFRITDVGLETLKKNPSKIDGNFLKQFPTILLFLVEKLSKICYLFVKLTQYFSFFR